MEKLSYDGMKAVLALVEEFDAHDIRVGYFDSYSEGVGTPVIKFRSQLNPYGALLAAICVDVVGDDIVARLLVDENALKTDALANALRFLPAERNLKNFVGGPSITIEIPENTTEKIA